MNIDQNNYEQWLLLYVDNELSAAERTAVEELLGQHPYLYQELEALQQVTLPRENVVFEAKDSLRKTFVKDEYLEKLLLHLDNELSAADKAMLQKELNYSNALQAEWTLLQKAKLNSSEIISFPNKQMLYKKEKGRVIGIAALRWMAAAMLLGFGFYLAKYFSGQANVLQPELVLNNQTDSNNQIKNNSTNNTVSVDPSVINSNKNEEKNNVGHHINNTPTKNKDLAVTNINSSRINIKQVNLNNTKLNKQLPKNNSVDMLAINEATKPPIQKQEQQMPEKSNSLPALNDVALLPNKVSNQANEPGKTTYPTNKEIIDVNIRANRTEYAQTAAFTFEENNNSVLMVEEENITRSKAGIFLKKIKRNIERRANIKPGKSLKIAGFELAVK